MVAETPQKAHQAGTTPGIAEGGNPPTKKGTKITTMGMRKTFTLGTKGPMMNTPRPTYKNKTVIMVQRRMMHLIQKKGITTVTQGRWDEHTTSPLGSNNKESHPTQGKSNLMQEQHH